MKKSHTEEERRSLRHDNMFAMPGLRNSSSAPNIKAHAIESKVVIINVPKPFSVIQKKALQTL
jgi:hypothetical protein